MNVWDICLVLLPAGAGGMRPPMPHQLMLQQQQQQQQQAGGASKGGVSELQKLVNMQHPDISPEAMRSQAQVAATIAAVQVRKETQMLYFLEYTPRELLISNEAEIYSRPRITHFNSETC